MNTQPIERWEQWSRNTPVWTDDMAIDASRLTTCVEEGESILEVLDNKQSGPTETHATANEIHRTCRAVRSSFMARHAEQVYDTLVRENESRLRLSALVHAASLRFPGLVPDEEAMKTERRLTQASKSGREIDQGIFLQHILESPIAGIHLVETMLTPTARGIECGRQFQRENAIRLDTVSVDRVGDAAHIILRNDNCLNAEDNRFAEDLETAVDVVLLDSDVKVVVMRGGEMKHPKYHGRRVFSAGINLKAFHQGDISFIDFILRREFGHLNKIRNGLRLELGANTGRLDSIEKPWLAAVDAFAIGGGAQTLLVFDRVIASVGSYFSVPAAHEGIIPGAANLRLAYMAGGRFARQVILHGRTVYTSDSDAGRVFDEIVEPSEMDECIEKNVKMLNTHAIRANRKMINLMEESLDVFRSYMSQFSIEQAHRLYEPTVLDKVARKIDGWNDRSDNAP